jgi:hypothetical protein
MVVRAVLLAMSLACGLAAQSASDSAGDGDRSTIQRELDQILDLDADWLLRKTAASNLVAFARTSSRVDCVGKMVCAEFLRGKSHPDASQMLLLVLGHLPVAARQDLCERAVVGAIESENRLRKSLPQHVVEVALLKRLNTLVCFCGEANIVDRANHVSRALIGPSIVVLYDGIFARIRNFTPHPHDRALAKRIARVVSGTKTAMRNKILEFLGRGGKDGPGLQRRIDRALKSFDEPPDILRQYDRSREYADLSFTCSILSAVTNIAEHLPPPCVDGKASNLRLVFTSSLDKYDADLRLLVLQLVASRTDAAEFLPMLGGVLAKNGHPRPWRHVVLDAGSQRAPQGEADHLMHLAAARALLLASSGATVAQRSRSRAQYRSALSYLRKHGSRSERQFSVATLDAPTTKK